MQIAARQNRRIAPGLPTAIRFFAGNAFVAGSVLVHPTTDVAEGAFLTQSRVAHSFRSRGWRRCVCRSRGLNTGPRDLSPLEKLCEQKKTTHATTRHALNISFLLFAFVILPVPLYYYSYYYYYYYYY